jgi:hypothetical protein
VILAENGIGAASTFFPANEAGGLIVPEIATDPSGCCVKTTSENFDSVLLQSPLAPGRVVKSSIAVGHFFP